MGTNGKKRKSSIERVNSRAKVFEKKGQIIIGFCKITNRVIKHVNELIVRLMFFFLMIVIVGKLILNGINIDTNFITEVILALIGNYLNYK